MSRQSNSPTFNLDPIVVVSCNIRVPGAEDGVASFEQLLYQGRSAIAEVPVERFDRELYFDEEKGVPGKAYTTLGGCVDPSSLRRAIETRIESLGNFDLSHKHFADVASMAWESLGAAAETLADRCGVFVGHSGGTERGGDMVMSTLADTIANRLSATVGKDLLSSAEMTEMKNELADAIREGRPRADQERLDFQAYSAASLVARLLGLKGPRLLVDGACASSLIALQQAMLAIQMERMDAAIVGGATFNSVDNLILFSQSQACSAEGTTPFDADASGLISSEGYVAVVVTRASIAERLRLPIHGTVCGIGVSTDGRGKSLWAPRTEGQQLAIRRGYPNNDVLSVEYQEAHATSTQLGDATELHSLAQVMQSSANPNGKLLIGSVKSNVGHTLEAAGLVGLVKVLIALRRESIPPSIGVNNRTTYFDWHNHSIELADDCVAWPKSKTARRAAVNSFGIGGINAHAVIEEYVPDDSKKSVSVKLRSAKTDPVPLAIVGRGVVLPGASDVESLSKLLRSSNTALRLGPDDRWLHCEVSKRNNGKTHGQTPTNVGGYIVDYQFDGKPYRIPPKQIQRANPTQMMLLDAVDQARREWKQDLEPSADRTRVGVVIGSVFGGEFSNQLQIGLRLPEIAQKLRRALQATRLSAEQQDQAALEMGEELLYRYPALLDETGSFTASTLASRIAKTFDWMGGACAIDADDASGAAALWIAAQWLRSGELDTVVCGIAQRSLDLVAFQQLDQRGRLVRSGRPEDIPADCSKILPGEGVATLVLKRLDDAIREGLPVYGIIDNVEQRLPDDAISGEPSSLDHAIIARLGYLIGGHAVVRTIAETVQWTPQSEASTTIHATTEDDVSFKIDLRSPWKRSVNVGANTITPITVPIKTNRGATPRTNEMSFPIVPVRRDGSKLTMKTLRIEAKTETEFGKFLDAATDHITNHCAVTSFASDAVFCASVIGQCDAELAAGLAQIQKAWHQGVRVKAFARHHALLVDRRRIGNRVAWLFPGQGSQYAAVPQLIQEDEKAAEFISHFDAELTSIGVRPIGDKLTDPEHQLGKNIWWTQAWVLAVTSAFADSLKRNGQTPDVVMGHSFGEWSAALHAGVLTLSQAIRLAKLRSEAVSMTVREPGRLLSVRGEPSQVRAILSKHSIECEITHFNSGDQVVIAGNQEQVQSAKTLLTEAGVASVVIPVPAAFHTASMASAQGILSSVVGSENMRPPRFGFLSATTSTYLAEPKNIADVLVKQLTHPVLYQPAVSRLIQDGCGLLLEVGPSDVLTHLNESIAGGNAICYAIDHRNGTHEHRLRWIDMAVQCISGKSTREPAYQGLTPVAPSPKCKPSAVSDVEVIDVTGRGRRGTARSQSEAVADETQNVLPAAELTPKVHAVKTPIIAQTTPVQVPVAVDVRQSGAGVEEDLAATIETLMIDFVIDQTGYSPDLIDLDADLESELAIDSIKKAQLLGELQEQFDLHDVELGRLALSDFTNLRSIRDFVVSHLSKQIVAATSDEIAPSRVDERPAQADADFANGYDYGASKKKIVRNRLRDHIDQWDDTSEDGAVGIELERDFANPSSRWLEGVTSGAGIVVRRLKAKSPAFPQTSISPAVADDDFSRLSPTLFARRGIPAAIDPAVPSSGTCRFTLGTCSRPQKSGMPKAPTFRGAAMILGENDYADAIEKTLMRYGVKSIRIRSSSLSQIDAELDAIWDRCETPHLFITTPHDQQALQSLHYKNWRDRRDKAIALPFRICQRWMQRLIDNGYISGATLVSVTRNGSEFAFEPTNAMSPESGAVAGLTKAMLIEAWMRGFRETPMKVIEPFAGCDANRWAEAMLQELAVPSHDQEVVIDQGRREVVRAWYAPLEAQSLESKPVSRLTVGGVWVVSGGGRGITAFVSLALAEKYGLKLAMLGTAEHPSIDQDLRRRASIDRSAVRREVMRDAQAAGTSPIEAWRNMEKAIEIDATLREAESRGIEVMYRCVDVSDLRAVSAALQEVRDRWGAIHGVLHGAGSGQDARFDRKRADKVDQCIGAKVDGCIALAEATANDPLEWFIGFGSISGRFGANGHTDYSLANDMLAKCVGRLRADRPSVRCVTFHWHAWGDIGMAAKPEAKLALEMIGMKFMPAAEGLNHFMNEIARGGDASEVLITDRNYVRKFFPDVQVDETNAAIASPLLDCEESPSADRSGCYRVTLDPVQDRFLAEHRIGGRATLPVVIAIEMMAEAARKTVGGKSVRRCRNVVVRQAIKFASPAPMQIDVSRQTDSNDYLWCIKADVRRRDGRLVKEGKTYFEASIETLDENIQATKLKKPDPIDWDFHPMEYPQDDALMFHGESLRALRAIALHSNQAMGLIATPSPAQLGGEHRHLCGWVFPVAVFDAVLYAAGVLAYQLTGRASLPTAFQQIDVGRLPEPGEPLWVHVREVSRDDQGMIFDADLGGLNDDAVLTIRGYRLGWLTKV